ncbi:MAG: Na(+)-translocating NADH-quinone reductase subunit A [Myxococcales bacterium FL481]|nr:MAG: Na(+)-translocating NADH-quinone reductase subunit A [Myxococcales bacterium FL481]
MAVHTNKQGLELPIEGAPKQRIDDAPEVSKVACMAADFVGLKPGMHIAVGDVVKRGQPLFNDRKSDGVVHTAPAAGRVIAVNRGRFRALQSVVIELSESERAGRPSDGDFASFAAFTGKPIDSLTREDVVALLVESGLWTALRSRPFGRVPSPGSDAPHSVFVTASDTNPLAASVDTVLRDRQQDFEHGLNVVRRLTEGKTYLCKHADSEVSAGEVSGISVEAFRGPHPAGTVGWHIHTLDPVHRGKHVWHLHYQDVIAIGRLFQHGRLELERVVALAGPTVRQPRLLRTRVGAALDELVTEQLSTMVENRVISGSVLYGRTAMGEVFGYLGRYHLQVSALREGREREFMGWLTPGADRFSTSGIYVSQLSPGRKFPFSTTTNGSHRAMVPIGMYERVFPFDILPTFLLRSLLVGDLERAESLGALELDEEDLALCSFVCPGKQDYPAALRKNLDDIWSDG